jgi:hypothetical protein
MESEGRTSPFGAAVWQAVLVVSFGGIVAGLTLLYRSMRSVMAVGGSCGSGGPYQLRVECPKGIPLLMNVAIWGGVVMLFLAMAAIKRTGAPNVLWLLWPALFLSLGFYFVQFGLDPPGGGDVQVGWMVCGAVFGLMGAVPLLIGLPIVFRGRQRAAALADRALDASTRFRNATTPPNIVVSSVPRTWPAVEQPRVVASASTVAADLERLASLHRSGALTDDEYAAAKQAVLRSATS